MISAAIPRRYVRALMSHAREQGLDIERLSEELHSFAELLRPGTDLHALMVNRFIQPGRKKALLDQIMTAKNLSPLMGNFLRLLQDRDRLLLLPEMDREFRLLADEFEGIVRGEAIVASEVPTAVIDTLRGRLAERMSRRVILTVRKDPALIGGIIVKIGSMSMDGSIRAQLDGMKEQLIEGVNL